MRQGTGVTKNHKLPRPLPTSAGGSNVRAMIEHVLVLGSVMLLELNSSRECRLHVQV